MRKKFLSGLCVLSWITSVSANELDVLIIGAGPAGLSVAKALKNNGITPDIIEKHQSVQSAETLGTGIAIPANATWALEQLGIDISKESRLISEMKFTDDKGTILREDSIDHIHAEGAQFFSISRYKLIDHLLESCLDHASLIKYSTSVFSLLEENNKVSVTFSDKTVKKYDLVIACDGIHSQIRAMFHPEERSEYLGLHVWRTIVTSPLALKTPTYMMGKDRLVLLYPLPEGKVYVYGHILQEDRTIPQEDFSSLFSEFGGYVPEILEIIKKEVPSIKYHQMEKSHSVRYKPDTLSRVLLMGDAAHGFGPMIQNGAAQAFEDAYVLGELLKNYKKVEQIPDLISNFIKRRLERVQWISTVSNLKIQAISNPQQIELRNEKVRTEGAPNVVLFKKLMATNP